MVTPEYNHSYPASLKAAIDWHFTQWTAKPVAFVSYGGAAGGRHAVLHLENVLTELHAVTIRDGLAFPNYFDSTGEDGRPARRARPAPTPRPCSTSSPGGRRRCGTPAQEVALPRLTTRIVIRGDAKRPSREHSGAMELVLLALAGGGGLAWLGVRLRAKRSEGRDRAEDLAQVRKLCEEDITLLGEQLRRLDTETAAHPLDDAARVDYQTALDAYESAQRTVRRITDADEISKVADTLSSGRYALACVQARVAGQPIPDLRVPCFFNPQHGPSVIDVDFTPPGRGTRRVPACAMDAARLKAGEKPEIREVEIGGRRVPYFDAGAVYFPYGEGYFMNSLAVHSFFIVHPLVSADNPGGHGWGGDGSGFGDGGFGDGGDGGGGGGE